jgi:hypothetical protein
MPLDQTCSFWSTQVTTASGCADEKWFAPMKTNVLIKWPDIGRSANFPVAMLAMKLTLLADGSLVRQYDLAPVSLDLGTAAYTLGTAAYTKVSLPE